MRDVAKQELYSKEYSKKSLFKEKEIEANLLFSLVGENLANKKRVLDVGCGAGVLASEISKAYGAKVYGIDINKIAVKKATDLGVNARVADIEKRWPFPSSYFDTVIAVQTIEHVVDTDNVLLEARRVLRKNGLIIISTPNLAAWFNRLIFLFGFQPFFTEVSLKDKTFGLKFTRLITKNRESVGHVRVFTLRGLLDFLNYYGFEIKSVKGCSVLYFPGCIRMVDKLFSLFPSLAADSIVVATKSK